MSPVVSVVINELPSILGDIEVTENKSLQNIFSERREVTFEFGRSGISVMDDSHIRSKIERAYWSFALFYSFFYVRRKTMS